jgi:hypothetical protein
LNVNTNTSENAKDLVEKMERLNRNLTRGVTNSHTFLQNHLPESGNHIDEEDEAYLDTVQHELLQCKSDVMSIRTITNQLFSSDSRSGTQLADQATIISLQNKLERQFITYLQLTRAVLKAAGRRPNVDIFAGDARHIGRKEYSMSRMPEVVGHARPLSVHAGNADFQGSSVTADLQELKYLLNQVVAKVDRCESSIEKVLNRVNRLDVAAHSSSSDSKSACRVAGFRSILDNSPMHVTVSVSPSSSPVLTLEQKQAFLKKMKNAFRQMLAPPSVAE